MATAEMAATLPISKTLPSNLDQSSSSISSPLSEVEEKDADPDEMDLDIAGHKSSSLSNVNIEDDDVQSEAGSRSTSPHDDESNLSEVDINDSEAETERLFETPPKPSKVRSGPGAGSDTRATTTTPLRGGAFQPSPSKLKQQLHTRDEIGGDIDNSSLSSNDDDGRGDMDEDAASEASSETTTRALASGRPREQKINPGKDEPGVETRGVDNRKRKRSPVVDQSESDLPRRKRIGSVGVIDEQDSRASIGAAGYGTAGGASKEVNAKTKRQREGEIDEAIGNKSQKRENAKMQKDPAMRKEDDDVAGDADKKAIQEAGEGNVADAADDDAVEADMDEEAEAALKNEEESKQKAHATILPN
jgi:hypothetical protein